MGPSSPADCVALEAKRGATYTKFFITLAGLDRTLPAFLGQDVDLVDANAETVAVSGGHLDPHNQTVSSPG